MKKLYAFGFAVMLALLASVTLYAQPAELVARYPLDETEGAVATDVSGNGFDAAVFCVSETPWVEGTIEGALEFAGTDSVVIPADVMGMTSYDGSVAFWMNVAAGDLGSIYTMFWAGDNATGGGFGGENEMHIHLEKTETDIWVGGELGFWIQADPSRHLFSDPAKGTSAGSKPVDPILLNDGEWHHVAATWGEGIVTMYIDGISIWGDTVQYNSTGYDLTHMYLGQMANKSRLYIGKLDDVRIYSGVLSSLDVEDLYNRNSTRVDLQIADQAELSVYPNPASETASIRFSDEGGRNVSIDLYSVTGAHAGNVYRGRTVAGQNLVNLDAVNYG
ncbi:MAG: LamG-like jellyroll fold domain-containing protein, partial [Bacteroidales bacterium]